MPQNRTTPYRPKADRDERVELVFHDLDVVLNAPFTPRFRRRMVDQLIWDFTEIDGKVGTRFRSAGVLNNVAGEKIEHEHVYGRKRMVADVLAQPQMYREIVSRAIGCLVTESEHRQLKEVDAEAAKLGETLDGWERYRRAGITVYDMEISQPVQPWNEP